MAKKTESNVTTDNQNTTLVQTNTNAENQDQNQTAQVSANTDTATDQQTNGEQSEGGDNTHVDIETQSAATGEQGGNTTLSHAQQERLRIADDIFSKTTHTELHFTSDFMPFAQKADAEKHMQTLTDKTIYSITR